MTVREKLFSRMTRLHTVLLVVSSIAFIAVLYWAFVGFVLDRAIAKHIAECEEHLTDIATQQCVMTVIPTLKR